MREDYEYQDSDDFDDSSYDSEESDLETDDLVDDEFEDQDDGDEFDEQDSAPDARRPLNDAARLSARDTRSRDATMGRKKLLLKAVNDVFNLTGGYKLKAIYVDEEFGAFKRDVEREFYRALYHAEPSSPEDLARMRRENAAEIRREESGFISPDLSDEGVDIEFGRIVRELFFHAGGTLLGRSDYDPYASSFEAEPIPARAPEPPEGSRPSRASFGSRIDNFEQTGGAASSTPRTSARASSSGAQNYTGLGAYREARRQAQEEKRNAVAAPNPSSTGADLWRYYNRALSATLSVFVPGSTVDQTSFKSFLRFALLRLCPESVAGKDATEFSIKDYFRKTLDLSSPVARKNLALLQLIERCVDATVGEGEPEQFGHAALSSFFQDFSNRAFLNALSAEDLFWVVINSLASFGRRYCSFVALESDAEWRFDDEYVKGAERLLQARFVLRKFNGDMSDFDDFQKAFVELLGCGARLSIDRLRNVFLQAGGVFTSVEDEMVEVQEEKWEGTRGDLVKKIVSEYFPQGLDVDSEEALEEFREIGRRFGVAFFEEPSEKLRSIVVPRCILRGHTVYYVNDRLKKRIKETVDSFFRMGAKALYFDAFFEGNGKLLAEANIPDAEVLCYFLVSCFPKYYFTPFYMEPEEDDSLEVLKIRNEILRVWTVDEKVTLDDLCERVFVSRSRLETVLKLDTSEFLLKDGVYERIANAKEPDDWKLINAQFLLELNLDLRDQIAVVGKRFFDVDREDASAADEIPAESAKDLVKESAAPAIRSVKTPKTSNAAPSDDPWAQKQTMLWNDEELADGFDVLASTYLKVAEEDSSAEKVHYEEGPEPTFDAEPTAQATKRTKASSAKLDEDAPTKREKTERATKKSSAGTTDEKEEKRNRVVKKSERSAQLDLSDVDELEPKARQKAIASALVQFEQGFDLGDDSALNAFLDVLADQGYSFNASNSEILAEIRRVGFVVDGRVYVVRKKCGQELQDLVNEWFDAGGEMIYYDEFFARNEDWLYERGFPTEAVLINRLRRYFSDGAFYDEYFEREPNEELTEEEKVRQEIFRVWDGSSSKRVRDLAQQLYVSVEKLAEVMETFSEDFSLLSNGYWKRIQKGVLGRKRSSQIKRKMGRKRSI